MKHVFATGRLLLAASLLFVYSCQKSEAVSEGQATETEVAAKVKSYLAKEAATGSEGYARRIQRLTDNLLLSQTRQENLEDGHQLLITPVSAALKLVNNKDKAVSNVLLLMLDKAGNVRKANIVQYEPLSGGAGAVPENLLRDFYTRKPLPDCRLTFLRLNDTYQYDFEYRNKNMARYRYMQQKEKTATTARTNTCTDWYLVSTIYFEDGSSIQSEEYVTTTCTQQGCVPVTVVTEEGYTCDGTPINSGGGGGGVDGFGQGEWNPYVSPDRLNTVKSFEEFFGIIVPNNNSTFNTLKHVHDGVYNVMANTHESYAIWSKYSWKPELSANRKTGTTTISGRLRYPAHPDIEVLNKVATWVADRDLR